MKKIIVAFFLLYLTVEAEQFGEDKGKKDILENFLDLKDHGCDEVCMKNCDSGSKSLCSGKCCSKLSNQQGIVLDEKSKEKIKWWINTQASKTFNFSTCQKDCDKFCLLMKGNVEACKGKCSEKFCGKGSDTLGFVLVGSVIIFCIFIIVRKSMVKNFQIREGYRYSRV